MEDEEDRREETRGGGSVEESRGEKAVEGRGGSFFISFREHGGQRPLWRILLWRINVCTRVRIRRADMDARSRTIPIAPIRIVARGIRLDPCPNGYYIFIYMYIYVRQSFPNLVYSILENTRNFFAIQFWSFEFVSYPNSYYIYISSFANLVWIFEKIYLIGCGKFFITSLSLIVRIWLSCWPNFPNLGKAKIRHFSLTQPKRTLALQFVSGEYDLTGGNSNRKSM